MDVDYYLVRSHSPISALPQTSIAELLSMFSPFSSGGESPLACPDKPMAFCVSTIDVVRAHDALEFHESETFAWP